MAATKADGLVMSRGVLLTEATLIVFVLNASSFFSTMTYTRSVDAVGILLTLTLVVWISLASWLWLGYGRHQLGLQSRSISRRQWLALAAVIISLYIAASFLEWLLPTEFEGRISLWRVVTVAAFTLTFGPVFEEFLFRGYLFTRFHSVTRQRTLTIGWLEVSLSSIFSGIAFGLWHLPTPIFVLYFRDPLVDIYQQLAGFIIIASILGILLGEVRRRTGSLLPCILLHLAANSIYVLTMALRLLEP